MNEERRQVSASDRERAAQASDRARVPAVEPAPSPQPPEAAALDTAGSADAPGTRVMLLPGDQADELRGKWSDIQAAFVDAPRSAVERADGLVVDTVKQLAHVFGMERARLEEQWESGKNVTTEDLRVTLQRYRSFFDRLLSV